MAGQRPQTNAVVRAAGHQQFQSVHVLDVRHALHVRAVRVDQLRSGHVLGGRAPGTAVGQRMLQVRKTQPKRLSVHGVRGIRVPEGGHVPRLHVAAVEPGEQEPVTRVRRHARHVVVVRVRGHEPRHVHGHRVRAPQLHRAVTRGHEQLTDPDCFGPGVHEVRRDRSDVATRIRPQRLPIVLAPRRQVPKTHHASACRGHQHHRPRVHAHAQHVLVVLRIPRVHVVHPKRFRDLRHPPISARHQQLLRSKQHVFSLYLVRVTWTPVRFPTNYSKNEPIGRLITRANDLWKRIKFIYGFLVHTTRPGADWAGERTGTFPVGRCSKLTIVIIYLLLIIK